MHNAGDPVLPLRLGDVLDVDALQGDIAGGYVTRRLLDGTDVSVLNYTAKAAYNDYWTTETRRCRGLVVQGWGEDARVAARPFEKFFDLAQTNVPQGRILASEKWDGSLGIMFRAPDGWRITTRGDPNSWQSSAATELLRDRYAGVEPPEGQTWLFEIVLPANRVIVDYGDMADLIALAAIDIASGRDVGLPAGWPGPTAPRTEVDDEKLAQLIADCDDRGREGFVLLWPDADPQVRAKVKALSYVRLHRAIYLTSTTAVWEMLRFGSDPVAATAAVAGEGAPELVEWVREQAGKMRAKHDDAIAEAQSLLDYLGADLLSDRRAVAERIKKHLLGSIGFALLDGKLAKAHDTAWKLARPAQAEFFREHGAEES